MELNQLHDNPGATSKRKRVGRGIGSGLGKTAGRGHKGQKSRSGVAIKGFEGGQMPIHRRLPKHGFKNPFRIAYDPVNLARLQYLVDEGKIDVTVTIDEKMLIEAGVVKRVKHGIKILGVGELKAKLNLSVHAASKSAIKAIEAAGGSVELIAPVKKDKVEEEKAE